jgi:hypothetical protein
VTGNDILDNGTLSAEARTRLLGAVSRRLEPEPPPAISNDTALDLLDRIRRPDGEAAKIAGIGPLVEAYNRGDLSGADFGLAAKHLADAATPEGAILARHRQAFMSTMAALADPPLAAPRQRDAIGQGGAAAGTPVRDKSASIEPMIGNAAVDPDSASGAADDKSAEPSAEAHAALRAEVAGEEVDETAASGELSPQDGEPTTPIPPDEAPNTIAREGAGSPPPSANPFATEGLTQQDQSSNATSDATVLPTAPHRRDAAAQAWLYGIERDLDYRIDRYRQDGRDPLDLFDPSKPDYVGKAITQSSNAASSPPAGLLQLIQNPTSSPPASALPGPPLPVILPNGNRVKDPFTGNDMMSPVSDLQPVAAAGRETREWFQYALSKGQTTAAYSYLALQLGRYLGQGGIFDYQRTKQGSIYHSIPAFQSVSNFNVGLFCQQAGLSLDQTLRISGIYARLNSQNAQPSNPYGLANENLHFITEGYNAGTSGQFDPKNVP